MDSEDTLVTDFGIVQALIEASGRHQLTTAGVTLGTLAYQLRLGRARHSIV